MEDLGMGFLVGALAGFVLVGIVCLIVYASRRANRGGKSLPSATPREETPEAVPQKAGTAVRPVKSNPTRPAIALADVQPRTGHTVVVGPMESREGELHRGVQEVRELILRLADVVGSTNAASGKAAEAFNFARSAIGNIDLDGSDSLSEAQQLLVREIDRVLKSNSTLHAELEKANKGIAEQRKQIEELQVAAKVDGLTRVANRAAFDERLKEYLALLNRSKIMFTLLLLDIDHFKKVNDEYGHLNGDRILRGVAGKIVDNIRTNDFAARYGGEEFAVIFPATGMEDARMVADRIRQDIARTNFRLDQFSIRVTISGGIAECKDQLTAPEAIIAKADQALYQAKSGGRNCVIKSL